MASHSCGGVFIQIDFVSKSAHVLVTTGNYLFAAPFAVRKAALFSQCVLVA